ncbi:uncharacterized protein PpBr36_09552 [Pyricularia pennisetigena]|uniref:uncharacterized protein n=1 Tax=Pyricularia pennisetigena TaxID=1578925 RepID=UPI0011548397|nr:uncharacterized protein PpBr36_09552 [Pyricularia pennisetigena]TLS21612.1 hypothetical protein PpBr36_09552 [Pyricularia pennisetigena]
MLLLTNVILYTLVNAAAYQQFPLDTDNAVVHQFITADDWALDRSSTTDARAQTVLQHMNRRGMFTAVVMPKSTMSIVGPPKGYETPPKYARDNLSSSKTPFLLTNGGFFVLNVSHKFFDVLPDGQPGKPLPATFEGWSVGPTSITRDIMEIPTIHKDQYERLISDDGRSFLTSAPSLKRPLTEELRFQFIPPYNLIPGGMSTTINPNERLVFVQFSDVKVVFAYTSLRTNAVSINHMRNLIDLFLNLYLDKNISGAAVALNLDGGGSVFLGFQEPGQPMKVIAQGYREDHQIPGLKPIIPGSVRKITTMVMHQLPSGGRQPVEMARRSESPPPTRQRPRAN